MMCAMMVSPRRLDWTGLGQGAKAWAGIGGPRVSELGRAVVSGGLFFEMVRTVCAAYQVKFTGERRKMQTYAMSLDQTLRGAGLDQGPPQPRIQTVTV